MSEDYKCTSVHWDKMAIKEPVTQAGIPEKYTQAQCLTAFKLGLANLSKGRIRILKTDLWTEGIVRSREVLNHAVELSEREGYKVEAHGIDISLLACNQAINYLTRATIKQGDIRNLDYASCFFDLILDISTIDHVPYSDAQTALAEYARCLKPKGVLVLMFAHTGSTFDSMRPVTGIRDYYTFPVSDIRKNLQHRFAIKGEYAVHFLNIPPVSIIASLCSKVRLQSQVSKLFGLLEYTPVSKLFKHFAPMYIIIAQRKI